MVFKRFVEIGRVCVINRGPHLDKLCVIIDVLDHNRAFVDGPSSVNGVPRHTINLKDLSLTDIVIDIGRSARLGTLVKAWNAANAQDQWEKTAWAKKMERRTRRKELNDFDRFKVMLAKKERSRQTRIQLAKLAKAERKKHVGAW
mmetsp:Transcript_465/g.569  ORF Transcript_465/g.569 Transcript_465/m.569 type:complete len:145 (-) Transcript_465:25-459(-)